MTRSLDQLRQDALTIVQVGIRACDPAALTRNALESPVAQPFRAAVAGRPDHLRQGYGGPPKPSAKADGLRYRCIAAGKAAVAMARGAASVLGERLRGGVIVAPTVERVAAFESIAGGHPIPDSGSERGGRRALEIAASQAADEELLVLLSGGASALMAVPADGLTLADKQATTAQLLRAGVDIHALNTVRKHLSAIKGGRLAQRARGPVTTLVISDVVGDDLSVIASGPTVPDASTFADARGLLDRFSGAGSYPRRVIAHLDRGARSEIGETPKPGDPRFADAVTRIIGSRRDAMRGAAAQASALGYHVIRLEDPVVGEARVAARSHLRAVLALASTSPRPTCVVSTGETTVTVRGGGTGGRNQEFALALVSEVSQIRPRYTPDMCPILIGSVGTDGVDGPTDAAGAFVDPTTTERARARGLDSDAYLSDNNAYAFFDAIGDLIHTGPTGTNVGDLQIILLT